jgi:carboxypeptidase family protein/TonB-dependent receptor-like protein
MKIFMEALIIWAVAIMWFFLGTDLAGQTSRVNGNLVGTVVDPSGAVVPDATIQIRNVATGQARSRQSDARGQFQVRELPSGSYRLVVTREGFSVYDNPNISISLGSVSNLTVRLSPASVTEQLTVTDLPGVIDPTQTAITTTIDPERIEELPVRSRNYLNFALLAPSVTASNQAASPNALVLPDSGLSFGGLRPRSNAIYIDGLDNNDEFSGASRTELSLETVREFQVVHQGLSAEVGGAAGGSINVITKTGANTHHGDVFLFAENGALDPRPPLEGGEGKPDLNRYRVGGAFGGALKRDRTFYYLAAEQEHARGQAASDIDSETIALLDPFLAAGGVNGIHEIISGFFPVTRAETELSAKIDDQINSGNSLSLRYSFTNNRETNDAFNTSGLVDVSARGSSFSEDHALVGSLTSLLSTRRVNDLRFQVATRRVELRTDNQTSPGVSIPGVIEFGRPYAGNTLYHENHYEVNDSFSSMVGRHLLKAGITLNGIDLRVRLLDGFAGLYTFRTLNDLVADRPAYFQQTFGNPSTNFSVNRYAGFAQDHWALNSKLTLDFGLRYDFEQLPSIFNEDTNNFSPRLGLAFSPLPGWVIRSGFGMFFDRYLLAYLNNAIEKDGQRAFDQILDEAFAALPVPINTVPAPLAGVLPSIYRPKVGMANSYSGIATLGVEHALSKDLSASATYSFVRGVKLPRTFNINLAPPLLLNSQNAPQIGVAVPDPEQIGRAVFTNLRLSSQYDGIYELENEASSSYHGLTLTVNRRLANEFELLASYTISKAIDDASDFSEPPQNPYDPGAERALSLNDQRQHIAVSALFDLPFGDEEEKAPSGNSENLLTRVLSNIEVASILMVGSGRPVNPVTGLDSSRTHTFPFSSRPLGFARNSLLTPSRVVFDLRILKFFKIGDHGKLDLVAESFNLPNRTNVVQVSPWFGAQLSPTKTFARPTEAGNPRQFQFSLDFEF